MKILRSFLDLIIAVVIVAGVESALFHFDFYVPWLKPGSYSGHVEQTSRRFQLIRNTVSAEKIILMGNSSVGAGLMEEQIEQRLVDLRHDVSVINMAQGGSTPRAWYYLFEHEPFSGDECPVVVLGLFLPSLAKDADEGPDLAIVKSRIGLRDVTTLPLMFDETEERLRAGFLGIFKTPLFQEDLVDLIEYPNARLTALDINRKWEERFNNGWRRKNESSHDLASAHLDAGGSLIENDLAEHIRKNPALRNQITRALKTQRGQGEQQGLHLNSIRVDYLRRVVELLNRRGVTVVLAVMPSTPFPGNRESGHNEIVKIYETFLASGGDVELFLDKDLLLTLEQPVFFRDMLHLNREGALRISGELKNVLNRVLVKRAGDQIM